MGIQQGRGSGYHHWRGHLRAACGRGHGLRGHQMLRYVRRHQQRWGYITICSDTLAACARHGLLFAGRTIQVEHLCVILDMLNTSSVQVESDTVESKLCMAFPKHLTALCRF